LFELSVSLAGKPAAPLTKPQRSHRALRCILLESNSLHFFCSPFASFGAVQIGSPSRIRQLNLPFSQTEALTKAIYQTINKYGKEQTIVKRNIYRPVERCPGNVDNLLELNSLDALLELHCFSAREGRIGSRSIRF
jgi:hypothetical protein